MIHYTCRLCGKPGAIPEPEGYDAETHGKWVRMLCHGECHQVWWDRQELERKIEDVAYLLMMVTKPTDAFISKSRNVLQTLLAAWCNNEMMCFKATSNCWSSDFLQDVFDEPTHWYKRLVLKRDEIRKAGRTDRVIPT